MRLFFTILAFFVASCTGDENQQINAANVLPPVFTSGNSIEVLEGLTFTGYVAAATDPEGMQVVFSISGGADEGLFSIEATSGRLSFITQPDFEMPSDANLDNEYIVVISAFDGRFSRTITVSIKVSNRPDFADGALRIVGKQEFDGLSGFGTSSTQTMASAGDVDGDGLGDFLIGAPLRDIDHQEDVGAVYLLSGKAVSGLNTGSLFVSDIVQLDGIGIRIDGISEGDKAGFAVSSAGDVDGDGLGDVLIGAPGFKSNLCNKNIGAAYLIFGSQLTSGVSVIKLSDVESNPELGFVFYGSCDDAASAGRVVRGLGDLDSDGLSDFTIGSLRRPSTPPFCEDGLFNGLACGYVFFIGGAELKALASNVIDLATVGTAAGFGTLLTTDFVSASSSTPLGQYDDIAVLENLDGDSVPDVLIGSGFNRLKEEIGKLGAIHLVSGSDIVGGRPKSIDIGGGTSPGSNSGGEYGIAVASLGDIDGNDFSNFAVGFPGYGDVGAIGPARGSVDIFFPDSSSVSSKASIVNDDDPDGGASFGFNISAAGDIDNDGRNDLLVASYGRVTDLDPATAGQNFRGGEIFVFLGDRLPDFNGSTISTDLILNNTSLGLVFRGRCVTTTCTIASTSESFTVGRAISNAGDINGDGYDDIILGEEWNNQGIFRSGALLISGRWLAQNISDGNYLIDISALADTPE